MSADRGPRPYLDPYLAGALLGVVLFLAFLLTGGGLGASGALSHVMAGVAKWISPGHVDRVAYLADMAGGPRNPWHTSGVYMLVGTALGGLASGLLHRRARVEIRKGPRISNGARLALAFGGGLVMAYGARLARGCTSGQALSGGAVLSVGSWAFMLSVFAGGYAVAWFLRRLWT
jgi:hypothetical protein